MPIETWKAEFEPTGAHTPGFTVVDAIEHSLRRWTGLRHENLEKHGLRRYHAKSITGVVGPKGQLTLLHFGRNDCALCVKFLNDDCEGCPLEEIGKGCLSLKSPYRIAKITGNEEPMLQALREALDLYTNRED